MFMRAVNFVRPGNIKAKLEKFHVRTVSREPFRKVVERLLVPSAVLGAITPIRSGSPCVTAALAAGPRARASRVQLRKTIVIEKRKSLTATSGSTPRVMYAAARKSHSPIGVYRNCESVM